MSFSKREENLARSGGRSTPLQLDLPKLSAAVAESAPEIYFAYLLGSAKDGVAPPGSDLDIAVYLDPAAKIDLDLMCKIATAAEDACDNRVECDLSVLNQASVVLRFEAISGRRLFLRPEKTEKFAKFFSLTCREYEDYLASVKRVASHARSIKQR